MTIVKTAFGQYQGHSVNRYTLENQHHTRLSILDYAGIVQEFSILDNGVRINLVVSSDQILGFTDNNYNFNRIIGRNAGRITNGTWKQDGKVIHVPINENGHSLHGGNDGLGHQFFDVETNDVNNEITLKCTLTPDIDGYPGILKTSVNYRLTDDDQVIVSFEGTQSVTAGIFNPTLHMYFNLSNPDAADISGMTLQINANERLEITNDKVPTGKLVPISGTIYDFRFATALGPRLQQFATLTSEKGLDDAYVVQTDYDEPVAILTDVDSHREIKIFSDRQGLVVYTANDLQATAAHLNRGIGHPYEGVAIEAQGLPDAPNHDNFDATIIQPLATQKYKIMYQYTHL